MSATLTYRPRDRMLTALVAGRQFTLLAESTNPLGSWAKVDGLDVTWDLCEYRAGDSFSRIAVVGCQYVANGKAVVVVDKGLEHLLVHGWPPCAGGRCLGITRGWDELLQALRNDRQGTLRIVS